MPAGKNSLYIYTFLIETVAQWVQCLPEVRLLISMVLGANAASQNSNFWKSGREGWGRELGTHDNYIMA